MDQVHELVHGPRYMICLRPALFDVNGHEISGSSFYRSGRLKLQNEDCPLDALFDVNGHKINGFTAHAWLGLHGVQILSRWEYVSQRQPRSQGFFPSLMVGREKALASAGHVSILHSEILCVINQRGLHNQNARIKMEEKLSVPSRLGSDFNRCNFPLFCFKPIQAKCFEYLLKGKDILLPFYRLAVANLCYRISCQGGQ